MDRRAKRAKPPWCWICSGKLAMGGWQYADYLGDDGHVHPVHAQCIDNVQRDEEDELRERHGTDRIGCAHCRGAGCEYCCPAKDQSSSPGHTRTEPSSSPE